MQYLLSFLIFAPLIAALFVIVFPSEKFHKKIAIAACIFQLAAMVVMVAAYDPGRSLQFVEKIAWIRIDLGSWGIFSADYFVAVDGLSMPMICLSVAVMLVATVASNVTKQSQGYFALLLILNGSIIGTFAALDLLLFYLFFEFMLLPMFFLIGIWGGPRREYASIKFFLYTLLGSILILIVIIGLYISFNEPIEPGKLVHSFNLVNMGDATNIISNSILDPNTPRTIIGVDARLWAFIFLFVGFGIKLPMTPFHTWLPDAHVEASTPISVILAALLLKVGGYGLLRIAYPLFPDGAVYCSTAVGVIGVISIIYGGFNALGSKDLKRLIAYSSVSHMGFVLLGMASITAEGVTGAVYQMFSHGIISSMLFLIAGVIYDRTGNRIISDYSGLSAKMPSFFVFVLIAFFASMGLPGFSGFIAEILVLLGSFKSASVNGLLHESLAIVATIGLVVGAAYYLWTIQRMFFGPFHYKGQDRVPHLADLSAREFYLLVPLALATLVFGIFPQLIIDWINPFADQFVELVSTTATNLTNR